LQKLTRREIECVLLVGRDRLSQKEVGRRLNVGPRTVAKHLGSAYAKLGVNDRFAALNRLVKEYEGQTLPTDIGEATAILEVVAAPSLVPEPEATADDPVTETPWRLPPPPASGLARMALIVAFALLAMVVAIGGVAVLNAGLRLAQAEAPSGAR
jgi:DNA-binding CsgD family transcriptional regulator